MILIVEDDDHKSAQILKIFDGVLNEETPRKVIDNVMETVRFLVKFKPDKIILDMSLPSHRALPGQGTPTPLPMGGIEVLFELKRKRLTSIPILILTQHPEIEIEDEPILVEESADLLMQEYGFNDIDACYYDKKNSAGWEEATKKFLEN